MHLAQAILLHMEQGLPGLLQISVNTCCLQTQICWAAGSGG